VKVLLSFLGTEWYMAHASMRPGPTPARTLEARIHEVWNQVQEHLGLKDEEGQA
jgi:hypothetical protein